MMKVNRGYYDLFLKTCAKYPTEIAVRQYHKGRYQLYTYSELYGVCEYIAQNLLQLPCNKGVIGLVSERNVMVPCVIAAAHKCCTTFMFLHPKLHIETIAANMNFQIIIKIFKDSESTSTNEEDHSKKPNKTITLLGYTINFYHFNVIECAGSLKYLQDHSFIAMTSGSTGDPKHIQVPIQCLQPNIEDLTKLFQVTSKDVVYFSTPLTFDPSMVEILLAFTNGASLLVAPERSDILFPENNENSITIWQLTPSRFFQFYQKDIRSKILCANSTLRILALGGEPFVGVQRLKELKHHANNTRIFTLYGVTEMSCWACVSELDLCKISHDTEIPLGHCLSETEVVVQPTNNKQKSGHGKIVLVSKTRKCVILNNGQEDSHSLKFVDTGDIGEMKKGLVYYRGRKDDLIKRFGNKINLQHIEYTIMQCPRVKSCSCLWLPKPMLLIVYFSSETLSSKELSDFLRCKLDDRHWPDKVIRVETMPMNAHGKVSKGLLSKLYETYPTVSQTMQSLKLSLLQELKSTLGAKYTYDDIRDKDFFTLGGTSFLAVSLCNRISQINNDFGKFILPYLISPRNTIGEIMRMAEKEINTDVNKDHKKRSKRLLSDTDDNESLTIVKRPSLTSSKYKDPVRFAVMWSYDTGKCVDGSPTLLQNINELYVVVGSHSGKVIVFNARSGEMLGVVRVKARVEASVCCFRGQAGECCGVVGAYDGTIVCFMLDTCNEMWRINIGSMIKSEATCCRGYIYVAAYDGSIRCIDFLTGIVKETIFVTDQAISADLVLAKNHYILTGTLSGVCASVHTDTHSVAWRGTVSSPIFASPILYDADRYVVFAEVNGEIHCRTVEKGIKIWKFQGAKGNIFSSIYVREVGKLKWQMVFGCHDSKVYSINVKNFQPSLHWKTQLNAPVYSTPCRLSCTLLLAASKNGTLYVIEAETGEILSEYQLPNETFSSPAVFKDCIYIGCRDDNMYCLSYRVNK